VFPALHALVRRSLIALAIVTGGGVAGGSPAQPAPASGPVIVIEVDGIIGPATADFFERSVARAEQRGARLVVLRMDTPGGLDDSMRRIIKRIFASTVPVATYVAPEGARAASAGTYILYASHIAAMAPATNLGAATPVALGGMPGGEPEGPRGAPRDRAKDGKETAPGAGDRPTQPPTAGRDSMREKAINDAAAYIRSLAQLRGRNAEFAEQAVLQASSLSSEEALKNGVIDLIATSVADLLGRIEGRAVVVPTGQAQLRLAGAPIENVQPDWRTRMLAVLSNPTLAMLLLMVGIYGLFVEFTSPGFGVPGVAGAIALLLAMYALQLLSVNWAGVALLVLGAVLMISEIFLPSFGALGVGGLIAFIVGGLMMFDENHGLDVSLPFVVVLGLASAAAILAFGAFAVKSRGRPVVSGREDMIGAAGTVVEVDDGEAWAQVRGERWKVAGPAGLQPGDRIRVTAIAGLTLTVDRQSNSGR
jgi:membrane-bound serine protease (ClpP class)